MQQKTVTFTNRQMVEAFGCISILKRYTLAVLGGFRVAHNVRTLTTAHNDYQEYRKEIFRRHAELDERGEIRVGERDEVVFPSEEAKQTATAAIETLDSAEVELKLWTMALEDLFEDMKKAAAPPVMWEGLGWMIED